MKIEQNTYSSSNDYKISREQVNSYKACTSSSHKIVGKVVGNFRVETRNSLFKKGLKEIFWKKKLWLRLKGQPPLNRQNFGVNSAINSKSE